MFTCEKNVFDRQFWLFLLVFMVRFKQRFILLKIALFDGNGVIAAVTLGFGAVFVLDASVSIVFSTFGTFAHKTTMMAATTATSGADVKFFIRQNFKGLARLTVFAAVDNATTANTVAAYAILPTEFGECSAKVKGS